VSIRIQSKSKRDGNLDREQLEELLVMRAVAKETAVPVEVPATPFVSYAYGNTTGIHRN
jgi:hypothetical protein